MNYKSATRKDLRNFGLVVGVAFAILATAQLVFHGKLNPFILYGVSGFLILAGLIVPAILRPFNYVWMKLALVLGWIMNRVILGVIFFVIFTLVAMIMKVLRRDILNLRRPADAKTYWRMRSDEPTPVERYERQF